MQCKVASRFVAVANKSLVYPSETKLISSEVMKSYKKGKVGPIYWGAVFSFKLPIFHFCYTIKAEKVCAADDDIILDTSFEMYHSSSFVDS